MKKMLVIALLISVYAQLVSTQAPNDDQKAQADYLTRFETAKQDRQFMRFVNSFEEKAENSLSWFDLPSNHLDCSVLSKKNRKEVKGHDRRRFDNFILQNCFGRDSQTSGWVLVLNVLEWAHSNWLSCQGERIDELSNAQTYLRSDLHALAPIYLRCKTLPEKKQEDCIETVRQDLYNLHERYFKQEQRLFPQLVSK